MKVSNQIDGKVGKVVSDFLHGAHRAIGDDVAIVLATKGVVLNPLREGRPGTVMVGENVSLNRNLAPRQSPHHQLDDTIGHLGREFGPEQLAASMSAKTAIRNLPHLHASGMTHLPRYMAMAAVKPPGR